MERLHQCHFEHASDLMYTLILGDLQVVNKTLLPDPCVPYLCTICESGDDQCIVHLMLVHKVEAIYRVT